ncbi:unnamed protein product [Plutella xylostella]|uniref:(diamondback moth) hypothetical protein n=1 Tax=Plutella xylostella TaxID=51655 RepID=A0A8S4F4C4_PLUXY|nr:sodium/potassium-transporting ATPase subunit beta-1 [Plutella xylostella]CAG9121754.1 unnamed protein product [Plutella xylostella]
METKSNGVDMMDWARAPPKKGPFLERLGKVLYDPEEKSFLGRTPKRWGIILAFYLVFYIVLAVLTSICFGGLYLSLDENKPTYTLKESLIGANPGVAYRPRSEDGFLMKYSMDNSSHTVELVDQIKEFLEAHDKESYAAKTTCNAADNYGFPETPCFFIKLNKIYAWEPQFYDEVSALPDDMPPALVAHISSLPHEERKQVWISCEEEKTNTTTLSYPWGMGLPGRYYPFMNVPGYQSPIVAVQITPPTNVQVAIRCRVWAKNVIYNKSLKEPSGYTRILLTVENDNEDHRK